MLKTSRIFLILFYSVFSSLLFGQKYGITKQTLDNGMDVIVIHNPVVPLVTIEFNIKNGAFTEAPEYDGLSHLYEHMFFKANKNIPNQERYMERLRELGAVFNGTTSAERVNYFITLPRDSLEEGIQFMNDAITSPLFKEEELVKERPVITGEYDRNEANPFFNLRTAVDKKVWWKYYSRKNTIGDRNIILTTTAEKMHTIQHRYYIPNNTALILAGDITPEEGFNLAKKYFSNWKEGPDPLKEFPIPQHPPIQKTEAVIVVRPVKSTTVFYEWQGPSVKEDTKSTYAADVLSFILQQKTSKFQKDLVDSALAFSVSFGYYTLNHTGPISLIAQTSGDKFGEFQTAVFNELNNMLKDDYFTDEQLENAKTILAINEQYGRQQPTQFVHTVGFWWAVAGLDYYLNYVDNLKKVTRKDIQDYLRKYVINQPYVMGVLTSPEEKEKVELAIKIPKGELKNVTEN
jgi:zinc protease